MRPVIFALLIAFTGPAIWAQKYPKQNVTVSDGSRVRLHIGSLRSHPRILTPGQSAPAPAPGVAQCNLDANGSLSGLFIATSTIPSGSTITGSITLLDDNSSIDFTGITLSQSMTAGSALFLPTITNFGDLWNSSGAALDIAVQVQPSRGAATEVDCEVLVGESFANSDLPNNEPLISGVSQRVQSNSDLDLVLNGYFTPDAAMVVLTDAYNVYLAPSSAVNNVSGSEIDVDLSQVEGLDLTSSDTLFLTLSQDGFSDTVEYRYLPANTGVNQPPQ